MSITTATITSKRLSHSKSPFPFGGGRKEWGDKLGEEKKEWEEDEEEEALWKRAGEEEEKEVAGRLELGKKWWRNEDIAKGNAKGVGGGKGKEVVANF